MIGRLNEAQIGPWLDTTDAWPETSLPAKQITAILSVLETRGVVTDDNREILTKTLSALYALVVAQLAGPQLIAEVQRKGAMQ